MDKLNFNKKISVTILSLGAKKRIININGDANTYILCKLLKINDSVSLFKCTKGNTELLKSDTKLKNGDTIALAIPFKGAVDFKYNGRWRIHKNDCDCNPSNYHAHNYDKNQTVDMNTGIIYKAHTKQKIGQFPRKKLNEIRRNLQIKSKRNN